MILAGVQEIALVMDVRSRNPTSDGDGQLVGFAETVNWVVDRCWIVCVFPARKMRSSGRFE